MKIYYQDDYAVNVFSSDDGPIPRAGESIIFGDEEWTVRSVTWFIQDSTVIVSLSQTIIRESSNLDLSKTVGDLKSTVTEVMKSQQSGEKKTRQLREQVATLRQGINQRIYNERKKT